MRTSHRVGALALSMSVMAAAALLARQATPARPASSAAKPASTTSRSAAGPGQGPSPSTPAQVSTPPLNTAGYAAARPQGITKAVYQFAAQHPEVLKYVPCYCGCEADGHPHNESCFVKSRDAAGNVTQWDMHGYGWAVCIDVARDAMQLHNSGADPASIRAAVERKWTPQYRTKTPTPPVPVKKR